MPYIAAREALRKGEDIRIFPFTTEEPPEDLKQYCRPVILTKIFSSTIRAMHKERIRRLILLGKAHRNLLYGKHRFDLRLLLILAQMPDQNDTTIYRELRKLFLNRGIEILPQSAYLQKLFLPVGRYGRRCRRSELRDVSYALAYAREINRLDIGQTVVVGRRCVLAVECAEGTNDCIRRGGELFHRKGAVVCKVAKSDHDPCFDIPTTGSNTLEAMKESGCRVLAIEAQQTFVLNPETFLLTASRLGITVLALNPENPNLRYLRKRR